MRLVYFAWIREKIGKNQEEMLLDASITTVGKLLDFLAKQGENYHNALEERTLVRVAINRIYVEHDALLEGAEEVALFPPMTGG